LPDETTNANASAKSNLYFHDAGLTDTGMLREHNEDNYRLPVQVDPNTLQTKGYLYVLADGMGGHQKGEIASEVTVEAIPAEYYASVATLADTKVEDAIIEALSEAIAKANSQVMEATEGGGTTVVTAVLHHDVLVIMNVGDSRAYLLRNNELTLISRDHSLVSRLVEMGKITPEEALTHPRRNVLYQALGQGSDLQVHVVTEKLQMDDCIILCSDGLWGEIHEDELKAILISAESPQKAVQVLIDKANAAGGSDNITVIIIQVTDKEPITSQYRYQRKSAATDETQPSPVIQLTSEDKNPLD
jgi:protein phosphatase